jgi:hypothetical protein
MPRSVAHAEISPQTFPVPADVLPALPHLLEAHDYARVLGRDVWEFALELRFLVDRGVSHNALRWLLSRGYAVHQIEEFSPGTMERTFRQVENLALPEGACFVLTLQGVAIARGFASAEMTQHASANTHPIHGLPHWNKELRELRCGAVLVKKFWRHAPDQELILAVFQEVGWMPRILDPLPGRMDRDPHDRLHDTIKHLNQRMQARLLRFHQDHRRDGRGLRWEWIDARGT